MRHIILPLFTIVPGVAGLLIFGYFALIDWNALQQAYQYFLEVAQSSSSLEKLFIAEAAQSIHRINLFAEGVWALLSAIIASIGLHGVHTNSLRKKAKF